ncbi:MAG: phage terminase large subunit [Clostridia bacterium]|nr:phage terminase large subunit [Clostridia bacterium]MBQ3462122.1 phage terminase large subunit [Clostridia bacterium]MBQ3471657.1 phage terminase large subunit [Clostridia bacterium]MBQ9599681.1 phage terminase large subunit [Clostridia bacterium]MBR0089422.1 phage terminase large subunit [Clostridia bacterium]
MSDVVWKPQPRQREFMSRGEYEALYGGAAGGGKSDAMVVEALRQIHIPHYKAILFRKTFPEARELILKSQRIYPRVCPKAKYNGSEHCWTFPSGARIYFGSMPNATSYIRYQGLSFAFIGFDELTHFTRDEYEYLISRNRADGEGVRVYIRATANPGGIGHGWVKERFITSAPPNTPHKVKTNVLLPDGSVKEMTRNRIFIPSSVFDNEALLKNDPNYLANLAMLPEAQKKALLYGDWDTFQGQVFTEWRNNPDGYETRNLTHVIKPFEIPKHWRRYRSFDFGYSRPFAVQWWAVDTDGKVYLYRQLYGCTDTPNTGVKWEPRKIARAIREYEDKYEQGNTIIGVADPSIWDESRGRDGTVITMMEREGVYFSKGKNDRLSGKMQVHYRLAFDDNGIPMMYVFDTCRQFIRTLPNLVYSTTHPEDIDTTQEDHDYDAMRYFLMENPIKSRETSVDAPVFLYENPLNL